MQSQLNMTPFHKINLTCRYMHRGRVLKIYEMTRPSKMSYKPSRRRKLHILKTFFHYLITNIVNREHNYAADNRFTQQLFPCNNSLGL